jgi:hypothetical protein
MDFRDELVYAGQFNTDLGYPILGNAARSVHQGLELAGNVERVSATGVRFGLGANATLSDNHFVRYREVFGTNAGDTLSYDGKRIGFFPALIGNVSASVGWRGASLGAETQSVGRMYLDNTEDVSGSIRPHTVLNLSGSYRVGLPSGGSAAFSVRLFNALDARISSRRRRATRSPRSGWSSRAPPLRRRRAPPCAARSGSGRPGGSDRGAGGRAGG